MTREEFRDYVEFLYSQDEISYDVYSGLLDGIDTLEQEPCEDMGEVSDGYHTFNQLYHQRAVLFAAIVNEHPDISWKSFKHSDGHYCFDEDGEMFIVGIDTPEGPYTYHYHKKYWDLFRCKELECGKEWDGHTEKDVTRLLSLKHEPSTDAVSREEAVKVLRADPSFICTGDKAQAITDILSLPSVTPQPKIGHWVNKSWTMGCGVQVINVTCSCCGEPSGLNHMKAPYCPNCGAIMVESQGSEE